MLTVGHGTCLKGTFLLRQYCLFHVYTVPPQRDHLAALGRLASRRCTVRLTHALPPRKLFLSVTGHVIPVQDINIHTTFDVGIRRQTHEGISLMAKTCLSSWTLCVSTVLF